MIDTPQTEKMVEHEVTGGRMRLGGRWYFNGQHINISESDAAIFMSRGISRPVVKKKVEPKPADAPRETIPAAEVGIQEKVTETPPVTIEEPTKEQGHGKSRRTNR